MMLFLSLLVAAALAPISNLCPITTVDRVANRKLSFEDFDQIGTIASSGRALAARKCLAQAIEANIDYLLHGPDISDYERNVLRFHTGQYLASSGKEQEAALLIASTRRGVDPSRPNFDWDGYVVGTYAFLTKDRRLLDEMVQRVSAKDHSGSQTNARVLRRFQRCFNEPYRVAYGTDRRCD